MKKLILYSILCTQLLQFSCKKKNNQTDNLNFKLHTFYYNWYGNPSQDGKYYHWSHDILPHWSETKWDDAGTFPGNSDIGANFYPELGCYSSNDIVIIEKHMKMMNEAGIGVFIISWWGKDSYEDKSVLLFLDIADKYALKVAFHIEPFYKTAKEFRAQLDYLSEKYGKHPALFLQNDKPFYYVYDSYKLEIEEWQKLLHSNGVLSVRNTSLDGTFIGLWVNEKEEDFFTQTGFDGYYTYFASDGFVYGSTTSNWKQLSTFAKQNDLIFIPCAGPGYIDTRIRPWNTANTKERQQGKYYESMFNSALNVNPDFIGITSFNEWHEGTQIEPAIPYSINDYNYEDYGDKVNPWFYIEKTKELSEKFKLLEKTSIK